MRTKIFVSVILSLLFLLTGCSIFNVSGPKDKIKVYTTLDRDFVGVLCEKYGETLVTGKKTVFEITDKEEDIASADCIIGGVNFLRQKASQDALQKLNTEYADLLPVELKDREDQWVGIFYDPAVFLINQSYSRKEGQQHILHWVDIPKLDHPQIVMENLTDNDSTLMFLASMSSRMGQNEFMEYFKQIRPFIKQFARFPITPVRMAATGDADIAITRRSHVFKYMQNDFPAYILIPSEGTPVNLYGAAILKNSRRVKECTAFIDWVLYSSEARNVLLTTRSGYLPLLPQGEQGHAVRLDTLGTNTFYTDERMMEKLAEDWVREIRLSDRKEEAN